MSKVLQDLGRKHGMFIGDGETVEDLERDIRFSQEQIEPILKRIIGLQTVIKEFKEAT